MPLRIRELTDFDGDPLNASKNKFIMNYESNNGKFNLISADNAQVEAASDSDISDPFVEQLEKEIDVDNIELLGNTPVDGGTF